MRSDEIKKGYARAPHRSLFYAMGYLPEDLEKPIIGVVNAHNEVIPGHFHLDDIAQSVKMGVAAAGGTPMEFPAIGICDGIASTSAISTECIGGRKYFRRFASERWNPLVCD